MPDTSTLLVTLLLVGLLLVLAETVRALVTGEMGPLRREKRPLVVEWHVAVIAGIFLVIFVLPSIIDAMTGRRPRERVSDVGVVIAIIVNFFILAVVIPLLGVTRKNRLADYGIDARGWRDNVRVGALGYLVATPLVIAVLASLSSWRGPQTEHPYLKLLDTGHEGAIIGVAFAAVIAAPLTEELIFRVVFQGLLESLLPAWAAILLPALAFAAMHGKYDALPLFPLALVLGMVYHFRRSYVAVVTIHAMFNATFLLLKLAAPQFS